MTIKPKKTISEIKQDVFHFFYHKKLPVSEIALNVKKSTRTIYRWIHEREKPSTICEHDQSIRCHSQKKYSQEVLNRIIELKKENLKRSARIIREFLIREETSLVPSETTIRRYLMNHGLGKIASESRQGYVVFEREKPNELWQIDIAGVQSVGHLGKIYLFALLDDCSRFIPAAFYASDQKGTHVIRLLQEGITTYGRPLQILADNGTQFKNVMGNLGSKYERVLHLLDIKPIFARVRHPQTKGKLERFFGTVKSMFLSEARFQVKQNKSMTLTEFNRLFQEWILFYNTKHRHRSLPKRCSPCKVYLEKPNRIYRPLEIDVDWNRWCKKLETRRVSKTNSISYLGRRFPIPPGYAGLKVTLLINTQKCDIFRGDQCIASFVIAPSSFSKLNSQYRKIAQNGVIGYGGKYYSVSYKMAGQQVRVQETADGSELLIYYQSQLIKRLKKQ